MVETGKKKIVRAESSAASPSRGGSGPAEPTWTPTPEAKGKATRLRVIAWLFFLLAIAGEAVAIFWILKQEKVNMVFLIIAIVLIAVFSITGSVLWKKANRADPAKRAEPVKFWIQNQLGAILAVVAFLPLILMIFLNKNMSQKEKGIAGSIAIVLAAIAAYFGMSFGSPSVEQYSQETARVVAITGDDLVYWTTQGEVYHLCSDASDVNLDSADDIIHEGTVGDAHADGKSRLTLKVEQEITQCGFDLADDPGLNAIVEPAPSAS